MMPYKYIFFDLDNTLWDFEENAKATIEDLYNQLDLGSIGITDYLSFFNHFSSINTKLWDRYTKGLIKQRELRWKRFYLALLEYKINDEPLAQMIAERFVELLPTKTATVANAFEVLDYLQAKNYFLGIITNGFSHTQGQKIDRSGLDKYFSLVVTSDSCGFLKPHKEIFDYALGQAGANIAETIMIGDNLKTDIAGAINMGMDSIFYNYSKITKPTVQATFEIENILELKQLL